MLGVCADLEGQRVEGCQHGVLRLKKESDRKGVVVLFRTTMAVAMRRQAVLSHGVEAAVGRHWCRVRVARCQPAAAVGIAPVAPHRPAMPHIYSHNDPSKTTEGHYSVQWRRHERPSWCTQCSQKLCSEPPIATKAAMPNHWRWA